jgi:hypothetical protein
MKKKLDDLHMSKRKSLQYDAADDNYGETGKERGKI